MPFNSVPTLLVFNAVPQLRQGEHQQAGGKWLKFHVMREDSNEGILRLKTKAITGENLMVRELILDQE